jgi:hypothetical protein
MPGAVALDCNITFVLHLTMVHQLRMVEGELDGLDIHATPVIYPNLT